MKNPKRLLLAVAAVSLAVMAYAGLFQDVSFLTVDQVRDFGWQPLSVEDREQLYGAEDQSLKTVAPELFP